MSLIYFMFASIGSTVQEELAPGETLLWAGRPRQGVFLRPADALLIPFSLLWGGFAIFWEATVITTGAPFFFKLWGIPFVLVGLYVILGRFFVEARQRADTHYAVTTERILFLTAWPSRRITSLSLRSLPDVSLDQYTGGAGTITFGPLGFGPLGPALRWSCGTVWPGGRARSVPSFEMIADARRVYEIIRSAQKQAA